MAEIGLVALAGVRICLTRKHTPVVAGQALQCKAKTTNAAAQIDELHFDCRSLKISPKKIESKKCTNVPIRAHLPILPF
jgi:hypothetical protein